ncbi:hypothetical protein EDB19DRAFT_1830128 [Suillus lakei]|nr:hypothetical protein EDB19DRAFT_1830128 [Suillus lakei]
MKEIKGGILTVLNEGNEIISWFCQTHVNTEITELLLGLKHCHDILDLPQPKMMIANSCCHICGAVASTMPETEAKLDVWHFSASETLQWTVGEGWLHAAALPELPDMGSGETFGLVTLDNATTFGGLLIKEETVDTNLMHDFEIHTDSLTGGTGIDPHSLTIQDSDEFYFFYGYWWVLAMEEYNLCLVKKKGESVVKKNPQALLRMLGDIKPKLMNKIIKDDYTLQKNNKSF